MGQLLYDLHDPGDTQTDVRGQANRLGLIDDGVFDGLADPPSGVGGKLTASAQAELFHRPDKPEVPLGDKILKGDRGVCVAFRDVDYQPQIRLDQALFCIRISLSVFFEKPDDFLLLQ